MKVSRTDASEEDLALYIEARNKRAKQTKTISQYASAPSRPKPSVSISVRQADQNHQAVFHCAKQTKTISQCSNAPLTQSV